jgi:WD40 repeat protein
MRTLIASLLLLLTAPVADAQQPARTKDAFGDPLPAGAVTRLGTVRNRATIDALGVTRDGTAVTVASDGGEVRVRFWPADDDLPGEAIRLDGKDLYHPAVAPDGTRVAVAGPRQLIVWAKPKMLAEFDAGRAEKLQFTPDGSRVVFVTANGAPRVGDVATGKLREFDTGLGGLRALALSGDGKRVAGSGGYAIAVWEVGTGKLLATHQLGQFYAREVVLDATGTVLMAHSGDDKEEVRLLDALTGAKAKGLTGPRGGPWVAFAPDDKTLLVGDRDGVRWWDPAKGKELRSFAGTADGLNLRRSTAARFTADGKTLVGTSGRVLHRWDAATGEPLSPEVHDAGHFAELKAVAVSPNGKRVATASHDGRIRVWDAATGKPLSTFAGDVGTSGNLEFSPDGKAVYATLKDRRRLARWDAVTGKLEREYAPDPKFKEDRWVGGLHLSPDGKTLTTIHVAGVLTEPVRTTWNAATGERTAAVQLTQDWSLLLRRYQVRLSPDGTMATTCGNVFPVVGGPEKNRLAERELGIGYDPGAFSGDGKRIAYWYIEGDDAEGRPRAAVYDVATGKRLWELPIGSGGMIALDATGDTLAAAGRDDLTIWDVPTGKLLARYKYAGGDREYHVSSFAAAIRFTPDGSHVVTGNTDTTAIVWRVPRGGE